MILGSARNAGTVSGGREVLPSAGPLGERRHVSLRPGHLTPLVAAGAIVASVGLMPKGSGRENTVSATAQQSLALGFGSKGPDYERALDAGLPPVLADMLAEGHVVVVEYWDPACVPCRKVAAQLHELKAQWDQEFPGRVQVVAPTMASYDTVSGWVSQHAGSPGVPGGIILAGATGLFSPDNPITGSRVASYPQVVVFAPDGRRLVHRTGTNLGGLAEAVHSALNGTSGHAARSPWYQRGSQASPSGSVNQERVEGLGELETLGGQLSTWESGVTASADEKAEWLLSFLNSKDKPGLSRAWANLAARAIPLFSPDAQNTLFVALLDAAQGDESNTSNDLNDRAAALEAYTDALRSPQLTQGQVEGELQKLLEFYSHSDIPQPLRERLLELALNTLWDRSGNTPEDPHTFPGIVQIAQDLMDSEKNPYIRHLLRQVTFIGTYGHHASRPQEPTAFSRALQELQESNNPSFFNRIFGQPEWIEKYHQLHSRVSGWTKNDVSEEKIDAVCAEINSICAENLGAGQVMIWGVLSVPLMDTDGGLRQAIAGDARLREVLTTRFLGWYVRYDNDPSFDAACLQVLLPFGLEGLSPLDAAALRGRAEKAVNSGRLYYPISASQVIDAMAAAAKGN